MAKKEKDGVMTEKERELHEKAVARAIEVKNARILVRSEKKSLIELIEASYGKQYADALNLLIGSERTKTERTKKGRAPAVRDVMFSLFCEDGQPVVGRSIEGIEIYLNIGLGKPEMAFRTAELLKKANPEARPWIAFDEKVGKGGTYTLVAVGADAPEGWTGFVPVEKADGEF